MADNEEEQQNGEEAEPSKLARPASVDYFFNKLEASPKLWQLDAKLRPNPMDKQTKFSVKTSSNQLLGWQAISNARMKFQFKDGRTKLAINSRVSQGHREWRFKDQDKEKQRQSDLKFLEQLMQEGRQPRASGEGEREGKEKDNGDLDVSLSTQYDNSKFNVRLKDKGEINLKLNQSCQIIPNTLQAQVEYIWEYKNRVEANKYSLDLTYTSGVAQWTEENPSALSRWQSDRGPLPALGFHKNQTRVKAKISSHADAQIKINSINHFGEVQDPSRRLALQPQVDQADSGALASTQRLVCKLQLENKLSISARALGQFNFKTCLKAQSLRFKQCLKLQTIVNRTGLHNLQGRYLFKLWPGWAFGLALGTNWNSHSSFWNKKWEVTAEKQGLAKLGSIGVSLSDKCYGARLVKKFSNSCKVEAVVTKKWGTSRDGPPKVGIKLSLNL